MNRQNLIEHVEGITGIDKLTVDKVLLAGFDCIASLPAVEIGAIVRRYKSGAIQVQSPVQLGEQASVSGRRRTREPVGTVGHLTISEEK